MSGFKDADDCSKESYVEAYQIENMPTPEHYYFIPIHLIFNRL